MAGAFYIVFIGACGVVHATNASGAWVDEQVASTSNVKPFATVDYAGPGFAIDGAENFHVVGIGGGGLR